MTTAYIAFALIGLLWLGDKLKIRALITVIPTTISLVGTVLVWALPSSVKIGRLVGFYLYVSLVMYLYCIHTAHKS
jgi:ACS family allantoate permease-like MFS transporter